MGAPLTPFRGVARAAAVTAAVLALAGCGGDPQPTYAQAFGYQCAQHNDASAKRLCMKSADPGGAQVSRYCYQTIGRPNCFDRPDPDSKNQALGSSGY